MYFKLDCNLQLCLYSQNLLQEKAAETAKRKEEFTLWARFAKDFSMITIWTKDTHRRGLGDD
jgi:hypothetical protein